MGCPAKKVCDKWAGSALMRDEALAVSIARAVVDACAPQGVPVTLKMRTGWCEAHRNAVSLARAFEGVGVQMLTVHGRTRDQGYKGRAEYHTIAAVKDAVRIPVVANGDVGSPEQARDVLAATGADAIMIGRAAQGRPWIFREVAHFLATGRRLAPPLVSEVRRWLLDHLQDHYTLYGDFTGVRSARKHIAWYVRELPGAERFRRNMFLIEEPSAQLEAVTAYFDELGRHMDRMPAAQPSQAPDAELMETSS
jgi:tRNA-dihydrouridine synthase B